MTDLTEFLLARIAEDETIARRVMAWTSSPAAPADEWTVRRDLGDHIALHDPARVLAECEAKRRIVEWHKAWPVLVETPPTFDQLGDDLSSTTFRMSKQIAWATEQEYRERFASEPPTGPVLRLLALPYADHPDYQPEWKP